MFGLSILQLILGGVAIASVGGGLWATANHFENKGEARIEQKYAPLAGICDQFPGKTLFGGTRKSKPEECAPQVKTELARGAEALAANERLAGQFAELDKQRRACSSAVDKMKAQADRAAAIASARKPDDDARIAAIAPDKLALIGALGLPEPKGTCEQRLKARDDMWAKVAAQRARDFPGTPGKDSGSGDVTIKAPK